MTDSNATELLPCAHCGGKGELVTYYGFYHINCMNGECVEHYDEGIVYRGTGTWYGSIPDAIEAWNTRATLGAGECELIEVDADPDNVFADYKKAFAEANGVSVDRVRITHLLCSECKHLMEGKENFCPNCGKAVKR